MGSGLALLSRKEDGQTQCVHLLQGSREGGRPDALALVRVRARVRARVRVRVRVRVRDRVTVRVGVRPTEPPSPPGAG